MEGGMNDFILFLHFFGLMLGAAGGMASGIIMRRALSLPAEQAQVIRGLGPMLANVAAVGVALLWITGLILVFSKWDGFGSLPGLFWVKFIFVLLLTAAVVVIYLTYAEMKKGNMAAASRLPMLGPASGISAVLAVLFAAYTFS
jgi:hypothetical protein